MVESQDKKRKLGWTDSLSRCVVSLAMVLVTQLALSLVPRFLYSSPLLIQLSLSVIALLAVFGLGGWLRRKVGIKESASAFVLFSILFIWCFYLIIIRKVVSLVMDFVFNGQVVILVIGLYSMLKSDPGLVIRENSSSEKPFASSVSECGAQELEISYAEDSALGRRVRYCSVCKAYVKGFDHHCPAFGNCIGQDNYLLFMVLLVGFLVIEASYLACSYKYIAKFKLSSTRINSEISLSESLVFSTSIFSILQLVWQMGFLAWHVYCICFNIKTDEWINWRKYPEFHSTVLIHPGQCSTPEMRFTNPYDKGILHNVREFLSLRL